MLNFDDRLWDTHNESQIFLAGLILRKMRSTRMTAWPSIETLAKEAKWDERKVKKTLKSLVDIGTIKVTEQPGKPNIYSFIVDGFGVFMGAKDVRLNEEKGVQKMHPLQKMGGVKNGGGHPPHKLSPELVNEKTINNLLPPNPQISENVENGFSNHVEDKHSVSFTMSNEEHVQQTMFNQNHVEFTKHVEGQIDRYGRLCENNVEGYSAPVSPANGEELTEEDLNYYFGVSNEAAPVSQPAPAQTTNQAQTQTATKTKGARSRAQAAQAQDAGNEGGYTFTEFWTDYNFKKGSKAKAEANFNKLSLKDRECIKEVLPLYLQETSITGEEKGKAFKPMRKHAEFFLSPNAKYWETLKERAAQLENAEPPLRKPFHDMTHEQYTRYYGNLFPTVTLLTPEELRKLKYTVFHENEKLFTDQEWRDLMKSSHQIATLDTRGVFFLFTEISKARGESKRPI